jgi:hypothetical protein
MVFHPRSRLRVGVGRHRVGGAVRRPSSSKLWLRIELVANGDAPSVAMFEPTGMTYDLAGGERMFADILRQDTADFQIVNWNGGISIWSPGPVLT